MIGMSPSVVASHRSFVWLILIAAAAAGIGLWVGGRHFSGPQRPPLASAVMYPQPRPLPAFELSQADGKPLTNADWRGHWSVVYFGYASCPDVCPTTLAAFKQAWQDVSARGLRDRVRFDFISIDPSRDTPEQLGKYVAFFSPDFIAATGSDEQLTTLTRSLGLLYTRTARADGTSEVDHSGSAVIIDPQARLVGIFRPPFAPAAIAGDLAALAATSEH
jgi:protein SCO1/2